MQIEGEIESLAPQSARKRPVIGESAEASTMGRNDDVVQMRIAGHDRRGRVLDHIDQARIRIATSQRGNHGRREHHVADEPQPDEQNG